MKGWIVREFGDLDVMHWEELPMPAPGPDEVRVRVRATGMNFAETRMRAGTYSGQPLPFVVGMEAAGEVDAVGANVRDFAVGQRVFGRARGAHAEYVCIAAEHLLPLPDNLSFEQGAAIPVGWLTAWHALHTVAALRPGQRVLIEAVASSVGSAALQIAKQRGCWVAGTASRDDKLARAREWGLDAAYNYKRENLAERVAADTGGQGVDVGLMTIGEETATMLFDSMGMGGKIVMYGSTGGRQVCFSLNIGTRNLELHSMSISTSPRFMPESMVSFREIALPLFVKGVFKPVLDVVLPLAELKRAHQMIDERTHFGKIVMTLQTPRTQP
ncbi:MAG: zinc-binding dehydrogenase [Steroidobacteraceae bacterium]|nr:zinc-binding dehydrogenase [Steroidobacteraceae bacterium]